MATEIPSTQKPGRKREQAGGGLGDEVRLVTIGRDVPGLLALFRLLAIDSLRQIVTNEVNSVDLHFGLLTLADRIANY